MIAKGPEEAFLVEHRLPFVRMQAKELGEEVIKLLKSAHEDMDCDDRAPATAPTTWMTAPERACLAASLEIDGCLVRRGKIDMSFSGKRGFSIELSRDIDTPWVLEQLLGARKHVEAALAALSDEAVARIRDMPQLCALLEEALAAFTRARNLFIVPNQLGFPRTLRPFNGFSPVLPKEYMVELSVQRSNLVITCLRVEHTPPRMDGPVALVPDPWFGGNGLVGLHVEFEGRSVTVVEQHTCATHVAFFDKALALINEARTTVLDLRENVAALVQPTLYSPTVLPGGGGVETLELAQPGDEVCYEWGDFLYAQ